MTLQTSIDFSSQLGSQLRDEGIARAERTANAEHENWSEIAYDFLKGYIKINRVFQVEDVRFASQGIVPVPKSQRSWGAIIRRAAIEGLVRSAGMQKVKNIKAHRASANVWRTVS